MKLARGISYHPFDNKVYVHDINRQRDYILEGIAEEILDYVAVNPTCSVPEVLNYFVIKYDDEDAQEVQRDVGEFVDEMLSEKIFTEFDEREEPWSNKIPLEVARNFAKRHKLFSISFELTWRCVERCIHCYIDDAPKFCDKVELSLDEYKKILRQAREMGCINILLTGGEVLLRPDLCDIVEYATKLGFIVNIYTTGVGLTDEIFDRLCAAGVNAISVSLYSGIAHEHDAITGVKGSFDKTLKAVLMFKAAGINTFIKGIVMKQNLDSIESLYRLGKRLDIYVAVSPRIVEGHECKCAADYALGDVELYKKFYELQARYVSTDPTAKKFSREEILEEETCGAGLGEMSVDPFGGVHPCITFRESFGSLREEALQTVWERMRDKKLKNRVMRDVTPQCATCKYLRHCTVCVADLINKGHGDFSDCGETLLMAQAAAEVMG